MTGSHRLTDYLNHIQQAATDAHSFVRGCRRTIFWLTSGLSKPSS